jgi:hypothetical protein
MPDVKERWARSGGAGLVVQMAAGSGDDCRDARAQGNNADKARTRDQKHSEQRRCRRTRGEKGKKPVARLAYSAKRVMRRGVSQPISFLT